MSAVCHECRDGRPSGRRGQGSHLDSFHVRLQSSYWSIACTRVVVFAIAEDSNSRAWLANRLFLSTEEQAHLEGSPGKVLQELPRITDADINKIQTVSEKNA
eukprot:4076140-Amphidinium_carterae.1